jgi:hypothetical protein
MNPSDPSTSELNRPPVFDWPLAYAAESILRDFVDRFLSRNSFARDLAERMTTETGTDFFEWIDHFTLSPEEVGPLKDAGLVEDLTDIASPATVFHHPKAMLPRVVVRTKGSTDGVPAVLAIRPESLEAFVTCHGKSAVLEGGIATGLRKASVAEEGGTCLEVVERLAYRGFFIQRAPDEARAQAIGTIRELWRTRERSFADDANGMRLAFSDQRRAIDLVGEDLACDLFFAAERSFWESRNSAARIQKSRQDRLGLGWGNHDHHTYRCSRRLFSQAVAFFKRFGFVQRERYYAGAEAGWGAQILEQPMVGIVVFADVDLQPEETQIDFSVERLPEVGKLGTVGLWCGLHGDSLLQAGMHHLEARFDFAQLRDQLGSQGITTMKPFSDFPFLKQAFTEGERWTVNPSRAKRLLAQGLITRGQYETFIEKGAIGSHLENLQRRGGFKGFNQKSVSVIIAETDPRKMQATSA